MKDILILINSPYLGGAERSIIEQAKFFSTSANVSFLIPYIIKVSEADALVETLKQNNFHNFIFVKFPQSLFSVSRFKSVSFITILFLPIRFITLFYSIHKLKLKSFSTIWANGNKIALPMFLYLYLIKFKKNFYWHLRDYPNNTSIWSLIWKLVGIKKTFKFSFIANSYSVRDAILNQTKNIDCTVIYNPIPLMKIQRDSNRMIKKIGVVSMMAPWKGIHQIIIFASVFEKELRSLGIDSIDIFGGDIYKTQGAHQHYLNQLFVLKKKLNASLINFHGLCEPEKIYNQIDLLIHSSIEKEPFGRVIAEAFMAEIPVISTGRGGAYELICNDAGIFFDPFDYISLYQAVKEVVTNDKMKLELIRNAKQKYFLMQEQIRSALNVQNAD